MKKLYNSTLEHCFPPLGVELTYTQEFIDKFYVATSLRSTSIIGEKFGRCNSYTKINRRCTNFKEECGSEGKTIQSSRGSSYCIFRKCTIPIWEVK